MNDSLSSIERTEAVAVHFESLTTSLYATLGALAPTLDDDAMVVSLFEMARNFGELAHGFGELCAHRNTVVPAAPYGVEPIEQVLTRSATLDSSGALTVYALCSLLGPRLLISLRDGAALANGPGDLALHHRIRASATQVVAQIHAVGELARGRESFDEVAALRHARELDEILIDAGFAESFGVYR